MKQGAPSVLILGGGVAGMAAARSLNHHDLSVHLVEEQDQLGGKAMQWACMATDTCKDCGACLSHEMARQVADQPNITLHLKTKIHTLKKTDQGVEALLSSGKTILAAKVILATGFSPFDPAKLPSLNFDTCENIITTAQLNTLIGQDRLDTLFPDTPFPRIAFPRIAFIQCVGSRNKKLGKDYCSQTCCKISLRHSQKLIHEIPNAAITLFYMDLQIIGKEIRRAFETLSTQIELIQGVPAEILEDPDTHALTMVTEDAATQSRVARQFDLVILSIGMESSPDINETAAFLGAVPNNWGFFNTPEATAPQEIYIAGCAKGPKDILSSQQEGMIAGAQALKELGLTQTPDMTVAIIGDGPQATRVAKAVTAEGYKVVALGATENKILTLDGTAGNFSIYHETRGKKQTLACDAIIAAPQPCSLPNAGKGEFQSAMDLKSFADIAPKDLSEKNLILLDYFGPELKVSARLALTSAITARKAGKQITILMNKMLVNGALGQRLYDQARGLGVLFLRFNTVDDIKIQTHPQGFHIRLKEATLPNLELNLSCDCLVLPESVCSSKGFETIAALLRSTLDREGFLQPSNVRHRLVQDPRKGIYYAGSGHDEVDDQEIETGIQEILSSLNTPGANLEKTRVKINEKECAQCLTCYRICPHAAIILGEKMQPKIMEDACFSCHLCLSNCPAYAIESDNTQEKIAPLLSNRSPNQGKQKQVVVFACERSAALAADKIHLPENIQIIPLPCACRISSAMILKALINGASKVIISGCHEGNCRSMEGSTTARSGVNAVAKMPGISPGQITWEPIAANETDKLGRIIARANQGLNKA